MEYRSGSNRASDLKLRARLALNCATRSAVPINCVNNEMGKTVELTI